MYRVSELQGLGFAFDGSGFHGFGLRLQGFGVHRFFFSCFGSSAGFVLSSGVGFAHRLHSSSFLWFIFRTLL